MSLDTDNDLIKPEGNTEFSGKKLAQSLTEKEARPDLDRSIDILRQTADYIRTAVGESRITSLHPELQTPEVYEAGLDKLKSGEWSLDIMASWPLKVSGYVNLRSQFGETSDEIIREKVGLVDEDSFALVWQVMSRLSELDEAVPTIEVTAADMLAQLRKFMHDDESNYQKIDQDPRSAGLLQLHAAVELVQVGDYDSANDELARIPQEHFRHRLIQLLEVARQAEQSRQPISPEESLANLETFATAIHAFDRPPAGETIDTRIVSNHSIDTFKELFDPFSDGRIYPASGRLDVPGRPTSGDNEVRRGAERLLGHERHLFSPRVVYGAVVESDLVDKADDVAWAFGEARFVLKQDSEAAKAATFTFGDSLNGTTLMPYRRLLRQDADRASKMLRQTIPGTKRERGIGRVDQYIESQIDGLRISDIESVILRPGLTPGDQAAELARVAEVAAKHAVEVRFVFNWERILEVQQRPGREVASEDVVQRLSNRLAELSAENPDVVFELELSEATEKLLFSEWDPAIARLI